MIAKLSRKAIMYILIAMAALVVIGVFWWFVTEPGRERQKAAEAAAGQTVAVGQGKIERDAADIGVSGAQRDAATTQEIARDVEELIATPEHQRDASAVAALCLRDAYRDTPSCVQLRKLHPR